MLRSSPIRQSSHFKIGGDNPCSRQRDYVEIHSGDTVQLNREYRGTKLLAQTLSGVLWRHYLHPEDKSLSPDGKRCGPYTRGLLLRRPIEAITPFRTIGKEIERKAQEGEDISIIENRGPVEYTPRQTLGTRAADPGLILRGKRFGVRPIMRVSGKSQHAVERFLNGERVQPSTRVQLAQAIEKMDAKTQISLVQALNRSPRFPATGVAF